MTRNPRARETLLEWLSVLRHSVMPRIVDRVRTEVASYGQLDGMELYSVAIRFTEWLLGAIVEGRELTDTERSMLTAHGEARGRHGIPVTDMFRGWRVTIQSIVAELITEGRSAGIGDRELLELINDVLAVTDSAILAMSTGHERAEIERTRHDLHRRTDVVRGILFGSLNPAEARIEMERHGLAADQEYRAIRARPNSMTPLETLTRLVEAAAGGARPGGLIAVVDGDVAGVVIDPPALDVEAAIGVGPPARLDRMEPSFRCATRAMITAEAFGRVGAHCLADLGLLPAVLADVEVGEEIERRYVMPLGTGPGTEALLDTIEHYLSNGMRVDRTAKVMRLHTNTVRYRLRRYEQLLDIDMTDPSRTVEAWWALQRRRLLATRPASVTGTGAQMAGRQP